MGVVVQAAQDDVGEGRGETFRQRRRDGWTHTSFDLVPNEIRRYTIERHHARHKLPHEHAKRVHVAEGGPIPAREQLGRTPCSRCRHLAAAG